MPHRILLQQSVYNTRRSVFLQIMMSVPSANMQCGHTRFLVFHEGFITMMGRRGEQSKLVQSFIGRKRQGEHVISSFTWFQCRQVHAENHFHSHTSAFTLAKVFGLCYNEFHKSFALVLLIDFIQHF